MLEAEEQSTLGSTPELAREEPRELAREEPYEAPLDDRRAAAYRRALRAELERRLAELATTPDDAFGGIGIGDAVLVIVLFVLLPALAVWIYR